MLKKYDFFDENKNRVGKGFDNKFEEITIKGDMVVIDKASELMWIKNASASLEYWRVYEEVIDRLNRNGYAGFKDWRLPTLEEAMSLMEPEKKGFKYIDRYVDPIIGEGRIWTSDGLQGEYRIWIVDFYNGVCFSGTPGHASSVCPVRSIQSP